MSVYMHLSEKEVHFIIAAMWFLALNSKPSFDSSWGTHFVIIIKEKYFLYKFVWKIKSQQNHYITEEFHLHLRFVWKINTLKN